MNDKKSNINEVGDLASLVKKAKRRTILRNTGIALVVSLLVLIGGFIGNLQLLYKSSDDALRDISMFKQITGPNIYEAGYQQNDGFLNGTLEYQTYKVIEDIPIIWDKETFQYNILGNFSRYPGNYSLIQVPDPVMEKENFNYYRHYNSQTAQREMLFYHSEIDYRKYINDLPQLDEMDNRKLVEMGISFDQSYTLEQIKKMLPSNVHSVWYWVDTYSDKDRLSDEDPMPESANMIYGFGPGIDNRNVNEEYFLSLIENGLSVKGKYYNEYKRIYDYLRKEKEKPVKNDIKILGVVVTGTAENLKILKDQNYIKSATLGVVIDKY